MAGSVVYGSGGAQRKRISADSDGALLLVRPTAARRALSGAGTSAPAPFQFQTISIFIPSLTPIRPSIYGDPFGVSLTRVVPDLVFARHRWPPTRKKKY